MQRYYVHKWKAVSLQWVPQTVEALSYSRNSTGSTPGRTERIFILGIYVGSIQPAPTKIIIFFSPVRKTMRNAELPA